MIHHIQPRRRALTGPRRRLAGLVVAAMLACAGVAQAQAPDGGEPQKTRVLIMDLTPKGVDRDVVDTVTNYMAVVLQQNPKLDVITGADVQQLAALEQSKAAVGCDDSSCLAEIADALGAELVIFGQAGQLGKLLLINLSLFDSNAAKAVARQSVQARNLEEIPGKLDPALAKLINAAIPDSMPEPIADAAPVEEPTKVAAVNDAAAAQPTPVSEVEAPAEGGGGGALLGYGLMGGGALLAAGGVVVAVVGLVPELALMGLQGTYADANATPEARENALDEAKALQTTFNGGTRATLMLAGAGVAVVGAAALGGGAFVALAE